MDIDDPTLLQAVGRERWHDGSALEIFSNSDQRWCVGWIVGEEDPGGALRVLFDDHSPTLKSKLLGRHDPKLAPLGTHIRRPPPHCEVIYGTQLPHGGHRAGESLLVHRPTGRRVKYLEDAWALHFEMFIRRHVPTTGPFAPQQNLQNSGSTFATRGSPAIAHGGTAASSTALGRIGPVGGGRAAIGGGHLLSTDSTVAAVPQMSPYLGDHSGGESWDDQWRHDASVASSHIRRMETDGSMISSLCEERDVLVATLRNELADTRCERDAAVGERDALRREMQEMRAQLHRSRIDEKPMQSASSRQVGTGPLVASRSALTSMSGSRGGELGGGGGPGASAQTRSIAALPPATSSLSASGGGLGDRNNVSLTLDESVCGLPSLQSAGSLPPNGSGSGLPLSPPSGGTAPGASSSTAGPSNGVPPASARHGPSPAIGTREAAATGSTAAEGNDSSTLSDSVASGGAQPRKLAVSATAPAVQVQTVATAAKEKPRPEPQPQIRVSISVPRALTPDEMAEFTALEEAQAAAAAARTMPQGRGQIRGSSQALGLAVSRLPSAPAMTAATSSVQTQSSVPQSVPSLQAASMGYPSHTTHSSHSSHTGSLMAAGMAPPQRQAALIGMPYRR